jgi:hypothetical protein
MIEMPRDAWRVFCQSETPRLQVGAWQRNATRFFDLDFAVEESNESAMRVTVEGERRAIVGRPREEADLRDALAAENARWNGLYDLAERRCRVVWFVEREGADDRAALRLAAAIATVALGPILGDGALFGVRTARVMLEKLAAPYR